MNRTTKLESYLSTYGRKLSSDRSVICGVVPLHVQFCRYLSLKYEIRRANDTTHGFYVREFESLFRPSCFEPHFSRLFFCAAQAERRAHKRPAHARCAGVSKQQEEEDTLVAPRPPSREYTSHARLGAPSTLASPPMFAVSMRPLAFPCPCAFRL
jgi:hypothetical protein